MKQYLELESVKKMTEASADVIAQLNSIISRIPGNNTQKDELQTTMILLKSMMDNYRKNVKTLYTRKNGRYPALDAKNLKILQDSANEIGAYLKNTKDQLIRNHMITAKNARVFDKAHDIIMDDHKVLSRIEIKGALTLPSAVYKHSGKAYDIDYVKKIDKGVSFFEYSKIFEGKNASEKAVIKSFMTKPKEQLLAEYKQAVESNPRYYEYAGINSDIPPKILNTGNAAEIEEYLNSQAGQKITYPEQLMLRKHMEIAGKKKVIDAAAAERSKIVKEYGEKPEIIDRGEDDVEIVLSQPSFQTSNNGCWSCAGQMLLQSRGVIGIQQEDIRAYRPNLTDDEIISPELFNGYNYDGAGNVMDKADSILAFAPNSMLHELQILPYDEEAEKQGYTVEQYINNTVNLLKNRIKNAIRNEKSPVAFLLSGHYITVTGIQGDVIKYKESARGTEKDPDKTYTMSLKDFVTKEFTKTNAFERKAVSMSWISDIKLSKDGKKLYGVPSQYTTVDDKGSLILPPEEVQMQADANMTAMNRNGSFVQRFAGKESADPKMQYTDGGIVKLERVYLPKKLSYDHLKRMADHREDAEEQRLIDNDMAVLGIDRKADPAPIGPAPEVPIDVVQQPNAAENEPKRYSLAEVQTSVRDMITDFRRVDPKWILTRSGHSNAIRGSLDDFNGKITELLTNVQNGQAVPAELNREASKSLADLIENVEDYLEYKIEQFAQDPSRKNAYTKQINEQPKIKTSIDILEKLYNIRNSLDEKKKGAVGFANESELIKETIGEFREKLLSDKTRGITNKMRQEATYKNIIDIDPRCQKEFDRLEYLFGLRPDDSKLPENFIKKVKIDGKKVSEFRQLKRINNTFKAIGSDDPIDKLSNKDFVAIAVAASTTKEAYNVKESTESYQLVSMYFASKVASRMNGEPLSRIDSLEYSRQMAAKALDSYKNGDKKALAHLIKEGLTNITTAFKLGDACSDNTGEAMGEMCKRLLAMMERDTELRSLAIKDGLKMENMDLVDLMIYRGKTYLKKDSYTSFNKINAEDDIDKLPWSKEERIEKYAGILMENYFFHAAEEAEWQLEDNPEYMKELYKISDKSRKEQYNISKKELKNYKNLYSGNAEMLGKITEIETKLKNAERTLKESIENIDRKVPQKLYDDLKTAETEYKNNIDNPDPKVVGKAERNLKKAEKKLKDTKKKLYDNAYDVFRDVRSDFDNKITNILGERKEALTNALNTANAKDKAKINKELQSISAISKNIENSDITVRKNIIGPGMHAAKLKYYKDDENMYAMRNPRYRFKISKMMREYIRDVRLYEMGERDFAAQVDKVRMEPGRLLSVVMHKEDLRGADIKAESKERVKESGDRQQERLKYQESKPEIFIRR